MALTVDGERVPTRWVLKKSSDQVASVVSCNSAAECVRIALINNMPDPALEDTEMQFFELLESAAGEIPVSLKLYSLPQVPRSDRGQQRLASFYHDVDDLWNNRFDALIMTGTEPRQPNLRNEPYWAALVNVLDWAETNTVSTILSCLAAHAGVLHSDGIGRHPLRDKRFGVFEFGVCDHALTQGTGGLIKNPHSRWNEVREDELTSNGYVILTKSAEAGADLFVKKKKKSLFLHFQGHPEYGAGTLLKEYRRDIRRFLRRERETYPSMPSGYFAAPASRILNDFREMALADPREELILGLPEAALAEGLQNGWHTSATCIYRNWLQYTLSRKIETTAFAVMAAVQCPPSERERSAAS